MYETAKDLLLGEGELKPEEGSGSIEAQLQLVTFVLLVEMALSDNYFSGQEAAEICALLKKAFNLSNEQIVELFEIAHTRREELKRLTEFAGELNRFMTLQQRKKVFTMLWRVSLADGRVRKEESEYAELMRSRLYLSVQDAEDAKDLAINASLTVEEHYRRPRDIE
jgi:uncharacterized tellurite resistance protein B-like protein